MVNGVRERIISQEAALLVHPDWSLLSTSRKVTQCQALYARPSHPRTGRSRGSSWSIQIGYQRTRPRPDRECTAALSSMGIDGIKLSRWSPARIMLAPRIVRGDKRHDGQRRTTGLMCPPDIPPESHTPSAAPANVLATTIQPLWDTVSYRSPIRNSKTSSRLWRQ